MAHRLFLPPFWLISAIVLVVSSAPAADEDELLPYEGEVIIVPDDKISRETALRVIKGGLSTSRSSHPDHADRVVCRIEATTGSRCKHLWCSTNGELDHIRDTNLSRFNSVSDAVARGGMVEVYSEPDPARPPCTNTAKLERALAELPPPDAHFVAMGESSLRQFADAYPRVRDIQAAYDLRINRASDQEEALRLQQQADAEMAEAIEAADLEVGEYNRVAVRVAKDEDLRSRVRQLMDES